MNSRALISGAQSLLFSKCFQTQFIRCGSFRASNPVGDLSQYTSEYEVTNDPKEWKYVENLLPPTVVPTPTLKDEYPSGWSMPSESSKNYPYFINRTKNFMQPVYLDVTYRGTKRLTCVRRIKGDIWQLENELKSYLQKVKNEKTIPAHVNELSGEIKFKGDHVTAIKDWLTSKGF